MYRTKSNINWSPQNYGGGRGNHMRGKVVRKSHKPMCRIKLKAVLTAICKLCSFLNILKFMNVRPQKLCENFDKITKIHEEF